MALRDESNHFGDLTPSHGAVIQQQQGLDILKAQKARVPQSSFKEFGELSFCVRATLNGALAIQC